MDIEHSGSKLLVKEIVADEDAKIFFRVFQVT
jgi:hypothetical protein